MNAADALAAAHLLDPLDPANLPDVMHRLRALVANLNGSSELEVQAARTEATRWFTTAAVPDARRFVDAAFAEARKPAPAPEPQGKAVALADPERWGDPVDGGELLAEMAHLFARYLALPPGAATALPLWVLHAHAHAAAVVSPILALSSPQKRSGKTTTLSLLGALTPRPLTAARRG